MKPAEVRRVKHQAGPTRRRRVGPTALYPHFAPHAIPHPIPETVHVSDGPRLLDELKRRKVVRVLLVYVAAAFAAIEAAE